MKNGHFPPWIRENKQEKKHQKFHFHSHPRHPIVRIKYSSEFGSNEQAHSSSSINHLSLCYFFLFSFLFHKNDEPRIWSVACFRCVTIHYVRFNPRKKNTHKVLISSTVALAIHSFLFCVAAAFLSIQFSIRFFPPRRLLSNRPIEMDMDCNKHNNKIIIQISTTDIILFFFYTKLSQL